MKKILILFIAIATLSSCKESIWNEIPIGGQAPTNVQNYSVTNLNGKSVIRFNVTDVNTLYIEAEYKLANGELKNVKASRYTDSLVVDGFSKAQDYNIQLFSVNSSEQRSAPVNVVVSPKTPIYITAFNSLFTYEAFGGIAYTCSNPSREALVIEIMRKKIDGTWESLDRFYTSTESIRHTIRGLKTEPQEFAFFVRDRWLNFSDTLKKVLTPRSEIQIPPADITEITAAVMPGSAPIYNGSSTYAAKKAFDGIIGLTVNANYYMTNRGSAMPQHFNADLKKTYNISRVVYYERPTYFYRSISPRKFKVWGSVNPNPNGSFDGWILLGECEVIKPSGFPMDVNSDEDNAASVAGFNFDFDNTTIPVRYLRIQTLETWGLSDYVTATEYSIFGNIVK